MHGNLLLQNYQGRKHRFQYDLTERKAYHRFLVVILYGCHEIPWIYILNHRTR